MKAEHLEIRDLRHHIKALQDKLNEINSQLSVSQKENGSLKMECEKLKTKPNRLDYLQTERTIATDLRKLADENERLSKMNIELSRKLNSIIKKTKIYDELMNQRNQTPGTQV